MCSGSPGGMSPQEQMAENAKQIAAQKELAAASLAQQKQIADAQAKQNQDQFDYQKAQDDRRLADTQAQAARQQTWDDARNANAASATKQVDEAFAKFSPDYFKQYQNDYLNSANTEIDRQYGVAQKGLAFGLARSGNLASTTGADQAGLIAETRGRASADQANNAVTAANELQTKTAAAKAGVLSQALSSETLGSPIAPGSSDSVNSAIDTAGRAVSNVAASGRDYAAGINAVIPSTGTMAGLFSGAITGAGNVLAGRQDAAIASAYGPSATSLGRSSTRSY